MTESFWFPWFLLFAGIHFMFMLRLWFAWRGYKPNHKAGLAIDPVTVIVAAHNEAGNIEDCIHHIMANKYEPGFTVCVADDRSDDGTSGILEKLKEVYSHLRVLRINATPEGYPPKKYALSQAIALAETDILLFTDADCRVPSDWVSQMAGAFTEQTEIVLGPGPYYTSGSLLNRMIQYETLQTAFLFLGAALSGMPYMGLGRNMAYRKSFFNRVGGFTSGINSLSGDDDLLVNHHAQKAYTSVVLETPVYSFPKNTWTGWWSQKRRHGSAGKFYTAQSLFVLGVYQFSWLGVWLTGWADISNLWVALLIFSVIRGSLLMPAAKTQSSVSNIFVILPLLDCLFGVYHLFLIPAGLFQKSKWN